MICVSFDQYGDFTPIDQFTEPHLQFSATGNPVYARNGALTIEDTEQGGGVVIMHLDSMAEYITLSYESTGFCDYFTTLQLAQGNIVVADQTFQHCETGIFEQTIPFDTIILTTPSFSRIGDSIFFDNLGINLIVIPTNTATNVPTEAATQSPTDTAVMLSNTPILPTETLLPTQSATACTEGSCG
jgi:hypothetical protein